MNRRSFLRLFGTVLPAVAVAEKLGLIERIRTYFFAPKGGWNGLTAEQEYAPLTTAQVCALQLEAYAPYIAQAIESDALFFDKLYGIPYYAPDVPIGPYLGIQRSTCPKIDFHKAVLIG